MTEILIDDDMTTSGMNSSTTTRRPMFIETEIRTDSMNKRRITSTNNSRSVYDILQSTKSPTDGLAPTTYTYAHSVSYIPVTQNNSYDVPPVMARRDLHGDYRAYGSSNSVFSSPSRFISNVRSQIMNGYSAIRDRLTHHNSQQEAPPPPILNSPTSQHSTRFSRTSSQSSTNGSTTTGYNLRRRAPIHSTPRDNNAEQRQTTIQERQSQNNNNDEFHLEKEDKIEIDNENILINSIKSMLYSLKNLHKIISLPWWLIIFLLLVGIYVVPYFTCKSIEYYPQSKLYRQCQNFNQYKTRIQLNSYNFIQDYTYKPVVNYFKQILYSMKIMKNFITNKFDDTYDSMMKFVSRTYSSTKQYINSAFLLSKDNIKEYYDIILQKVNHLIKRGKENYFEYRHADQQAELEVIIRQLLDEYAADETGQADYALEANGGKIIDTKCTEYTDEPRQNVVKFLGIPIVHMSKQPEIMIKAGRMPGQCFPFKGDQGSVIIKLAVPVKPIEFVLEHLSKSVSILGHIKSAPNNFTVYALKNKNDSEGTVLGRYYYDAENGPSLQRFKPQLVNVPIVEYIELRINSNWGNPSYTCVYRFRVHGDLPMVKPSAH